ncbi:MAG: hypothetical protein M3071_09060 [Actinomycetota bacterium]|nr:hypothetical protein [Actinomycetota bacterium]
MTVSKLETRKDVAQAVIESGVDHVGQIMTIIVGAVGDVTSELGAWATDVFELRDAARRAQADREHGEDGALRALKGPDGHEFAGGEHPGPSS